MSLWNAPMMSDNATNEHKIYGGGGPLSEGGKSFLDTNASTRADTVFSTTAGFSATHRTIDSSAWSQGTAAGASGQARLAEVEPTMSDARFELNMLVDKTNMLKNEAVRKNLDVEIKRHGAQSVESYFAQTAASRSTKAPQAPQAERSPEADDWFNLKTLIGSMQETVKDLEKDESCKFPRPGGQVAANLDGFLMQSQASPGAPIHATNQPDQWFSPRGARHVDGNLAREGELVWNAEKQQSVREGGWGDPLLFGPKDCIPEHAVFRQQLILKHPTRRTDFENGVLPSAPPSEPSSAPVSPTKSPKRWWHRFWPFSWSSRNEPSSEGVNRIVVQPAQSDETGVSVTQGVQDNQGSRLDFAFTESKLDPLRPTHHDTIGSLRSDFENFLRQERHNAQEFQRKLTQIEENGKSMWSEIQGLKQQMSAPGALPGAVPADGLGASGAQMHATRSLTGASSFSAAAAAPSGKSVEPVGLPAQPLDSWTDERPVALQPNASVSHSTTGIRGVASDDQATAHQPLPPPASGPEEPNDGA